jgi:hypothetical protein
VSGTIRTVVLVAVSFFCGAAATKLWSAWQLRTANSCEALLSRQNIPNPFHLTGNDCGVMDVSKATEHKSKPPSPRNLPPFGEGVQSRCWVGTEMRLSCATALAA